MRVARLVAKGFGDGPVPVRYAFRRC